MIWDEDKQETVGIERTNKYGISTITYVQLVRCKDCDNKECWGRAGDVVCGIDGKPHRQDWFCAYGVAKDINVPDKKGL